MPACVLGALSGRNAELSLLTWLASDGRKCTEATGSDDPHHDDEPPETHAKASESVEERVHLSGVSLSGRGLSGGCRNDHRPRHRGAPRRTGRRQAGYAGTPLSVRNLAARRSRSRPPSRRSCRAALRRSQSLGRAARAASRERLADTMAALAAGRTYILFSSADPEARAARTPTHPTGSPSSSASNDTAARAARRRCARSASSSSTAWKSSENGSDATYSRTSWSNRTSSSGGRHPRDRHVAPRHTDTPTGRTATPNSDGSYPRHRSLVPTEEHG